MRYIFIIALLILGSWIVSAKLDKALVKDLPGLVNASSTMYSGYHEVSKTRSLFYVFVESRDKPETDPIIVWFSGGPGGSSTPDVFQPRGHGPYSYTNSTFIEENPFAWNKKSNMLYIDSPAGVGYSIAERDIDYAQNDF
jgi:carboxypeptidase C (cathepsin A)